MRKADQEVRLKGAKQRTVLATLLLARERVVPDAELGGLLWGKQPPETYRAQIYTHISRLRRYVGDRVPIVRCGSGYSLRLSSAWFDHSEFEQLVQAGRQALRTESFGPAAESLRCALNLWRGPALADVTAPLADRERPAIEEMRMDVLERRIEADLALGRHRQLTAELASLVNAYPFRERIRAQFILALYRSDRQADAIEAYRHGCRLLEENLGVDPGATLRNTYQSIMAM